MNSLFERASVREFTEEEVEIQDIEDIIRAGMQAPSAMNSQPWEFIVVNDPEDMEAVSKMSPYRLFPTGFRSMYSELSSRSY